jgi:hypothetical protein
MVFNAVMRNDSIVQCDSCQRILYYVPATPGEGASTPGASNSQTAAS